MLLRTLAVPMLSAFVLLAQDAPSQPAPTEATVAPAEKTYPVPMGTKILMRMVSTVTSKEANPGTSLYLETAFPVFVNGRMVIPQGSYVLGTVTASVRPGKVKGKGELYLRFDSLTLPNGVTRDFHAALSNIDGGSPGTVDRAESGVKSDGNVGEDMKTIGKGAGVGAGIGGLASIGRPPGMGIGIGAGAGAVAGLVAVLFTRGPDAMLTKGTNVEMILDRELLYHDSELNFSKPAPQFYSTEGQTQNRPVLERR